MDVESVAASIKVRILGELFVLANEFATIDSLLIFSEFSFSALFRFSSVCRDSVSEEVPEKFS